jgi:thiosulfate reductase cytochrome b subunit
MSRPPAKQVIRRHSVVVRVTHWINVLCLTVLLMSGLQIFNAHPALYWGDRSQFHHPILAMDAETQAGHDIGVTTIFGHAFDTTGWFGLSDDSSGNPNERGFPSWATIPSYQALADGRRWHFFFAWLFVINGLVYIGYSIGSRHLWRDLSPSRRQLGHIGREILNHLRFRFPKGEEARQYNVLQKLTYLAVLVLLVAIILAGMTMSPQLDTDFPFLLSLFGGRQSARTIHFIIAFALLGFVAIHIFMVLVSGVWNNMRSMITGRYVIERQPSDDPKIAP